MSQKVRWGMVALHRWCMGEWTDTEIWRSSGYQHGLTTLGLCMSFWAVPIRSYIQDGTGWTAAVRGTQRAFMYVRCWI